MLHGDEMVNTKTYLQLNPQVYAVTARTYLYLGVLLCTELLHWFMVATFQLQLQQECEWCKFYEQYIVMFFTRTKIRNRSPIWGHVKCAHSSYTGDQCADRGRVVNSQHCVQLVVDETKHRAVEVDVCTHDLIVDVWRLLTSTSQTMHETSVNIRIIRQYSDRNQSLTFFENHVWRWNGDIAIERLTLYILIKAFLAEKKRIEMQPF